MSDVVKEANRNKERHVESIEYETCIVVKYRCASCGATFEERYQKLEFLDTPLCRDCIADWKMGEI